ncbi:bifunctional glycosyltransferase/CDP-glycerol:glycerophosphate glycerophosphotransferase [Streptacidiphilus jiangxiensis]|uniref:CDP-glycerol glycerophosphotransferase, TagB/SpsB family n=1 Tax=Streptacidiphilus jiangxiensis TaxID=235985 RepID=A0A1H7ME08_STRJI|nr:bifunctional glycosyltransferase/CDP-glycerol:glycerophosphate glycerophosphotransferase [Streptacidiphilus jiangxiensis]SEL08837.1 CDP-glycerol glycerophosphotransferase, TagB/SpsB family [Streptacidiphilus jiangxiensis]
MPPRLSVVVPIYNVERYLDECLASLAAQTMGDFEVVMVDDGSTDGSGAIAHAWAMRDPRFRTVRKENGGLGPARNTGIDELTPGTEFLAFVDSDDTLPPTAYELMLTTLDQTGSDFVAGNVKRFRIAGERQSPVHARPFARTRLSTHISEFPALITDRTAWNKVYRRSFFDAHGLRYPGILYEDAPVSVPLHYLADKVDILSDPIYNWRERETGERSITQNRSDPRGLTDRVASMRLVREFLIAQSGQEYRDYLRAYDRNALAEEIPLFFGAAIDGDAELHQVFADHVGKLLTEIGPAQINRLPVPHRLRYHLIAERRIEDFLALLRWQWDHKGAIPVRGALRPRAAYPVLEDRAPIPASVLRLGPELVVRTQLGGADWDAKGVLRLTGFAYPTHLGAPARHSALKMVMLRETHSRRTVLLPAKTVRTPEVTADHGQLLRDCDLAGFAVGVDPKRLRQDGRWVDGTWRVTVAVVGAGRPRRSRIKAGHHASGQSPRSSWVADDVRLVPEIRDQHLYLRVEHAHALAGAVHEHAGKLELTGRIRAAVARRVQSLRIRHLEQGSAAVIELPVTFAAAGSTATTAEEAGAEADAYLAGREDALRALGVNVPVTGTATPAGTALAGPAGAGPVSGPGVTTAPLRTGAVNPVNGNGAANNGTADNDAAPSLPDAGLTAGPDGLDGWVPFSATLDLAELDTAREEYTAVRSHVAADHGHRWAVDLRLDTDDEEDEESGSLRLVHDERTQPEAFQVPLPGDGDARRVVCVKRSPTGYLQLVDQPTQPLFEQIVADLPKEAFRLTGSYPLPGRHPLELVLRHPTQARPEVHPFEAVDGRIDTLLPAVPVSGYAGEVPLAGGEWQLFVRRPAPVDRAPGTPKPLECQARLSPVAHAGTPVPVQARGKTVRLTRQGYDGMLLHVGSALSPLERGDYHQRLLHTRELPAARRRPLLPQVLYDVFEGRSYSCSPRAVHQEMLRRGDGRVAHLWAVLDYRMPTPPGARTVLIGSAEWYEALARSRWIVGNTHLPEELERRQGQVVVQTWHGTPLKRIGFDFDNDWFTDTDYLRRLEHEAKQWQVLLSPNRFSTPILRQAFHYEGEILESGYPRNDMLLAADREQRAQVVRERLGLPPGKRVVLYAPTWREHQVRLHHGGHHLDLHLDVVDMRRALGPDHVLLVRPHAHVVDTVPGAGNGFVWDVGSYPDIQDLYLVADVLITDYSSAMFDFAVTGRPILFFTYDLELYRDTLRGFYLDFEAQAPGPLLRTSAEVVAALRDLPAAVEAYRSAYEVFRKTYCDLDDGVASARVVDRMLELGG